MYNRYIPQPDGSFRRSRLQEPVRPQPQKPPSQPEEKPQKTQKAAPDCPPPAPQPSQKTSPGCAAPRCPKARKESHCSGTDVGSFFKNLLPKDFDTSDLLIVVLLLLMAGDCQDDQNTALLTLALYLFQ